MTRALAVLGALLLSLLAPVTVPGYAAGSAAGPEPLAPPTVSGTAVVGQVLTGRPGEWDPEPASYSWQWLRDGEPVAGATTRYRRLAAADLGGRMSVRVTAHGDDGSAATAVSETTAPVARGTLRVRRWPSVVGDPRWGETLRARLGAWRPWPATVRVQWLRDGEPVRGATERSFRPRPGDVGHRIAVRVTGAHPGHAPRRVTSRPVRVTHRVPARRTVTYRVETRGALTTSVAVFRRQAQQTFDDPRGWRAGGVAFRRVARGGDFTLVLAEASWLPRFSSGCSAEWSCRVGRHVVINQERWKHASPAWNRAGGSLRDYRHMVVNHETGHWLGRGHTGCPGRGRPAPVMMQQSKDLDGCRFNPWPTRAER